MLIYLAAPYSSKDPKVTEERIRQFCRADANLSALGIATISPLLKHLVLQYEPLPGDWNYWKDYSETLLRKCDKMIVLMLDGWQESVGVQAEIELCQQLNIPIKYMLPENYAGEL